MGGSREEDRESVPPPPHLKNHKNIVFLAILFQNLSFRWRADDGPLLVVFGSSLPHNLKKTLSELGPLWQYFMDAHEAYVI